jgi:hypothetical protein
MKGIFVGLVVVVGVFTGSYVKSMDAKSGLEQPLLPAATHGGTTSPLVVRREAARDICPQRIPHGPMVERVLSSCCCVSKINPEYVVQLKLLHTVLSSLMTIYPKALREFFLKCRSNHYVLSPDVQTSLDNLGLTFNGSPDRSWAEATINLLAAGKDAASFETLCFNAGIEDLYKKFPADVEALRAGTGFIEQELCSKLALGYRLIKNTGSIEREELQRIMQFYHAIQSVLASSGEATTLILLPAERIFKS